MLVLFALTGYFGGEEVATFIIDRLSAALPGSADEPDSAAGFIGTFVEEVVRVRAPGPLSIGLVTGIWAASAVFVALTDSLNLAYDVEDDRPWLKRRGLSIAVMILFLLLFLGGSAVMLAGPAVARGLDLGGVANVTWNILQWPLAFGLVVAAFFIVYYLLPNRDQSGCKAPIAKSAAIAAGLWLVATIGFRLYVYNLGTFNETYGFVGTILVLLLWMYLTAMVILLGGEIGSEMERSARR
jgi:membrane protein